MSNRSLQSSPRSYSERKVATRQLRKRFLIICEGTKTEPKYFKSFPVPTATVDDVIGVANDPLTLVRRAIQLNNEEVYEETWCVFDRDDWPKEKFNNAISTAQYQGYKIAYSNEAFELWYVLHFEYLNSGIPRNHYITKLNRLLGHEYRKNSSTIYEELESMINTAIRNAERLLKSYEPQNPESNNPSTTVHILVKELISRYKDNLVSGT